MSEADLTGPVACYGQTLVLVQALQDNLIELLYPTTQAFPLLPQSQDRCARVPIGHLALNLDFAHVGDRSADAGGVAAKQWQG